MAALRSEVVPYQQAVAVASRLAPGFVVPNDCHPPPLDSPYSMPKRAPRLPLGRPRRSRFLVLDGGTSGGVRARRPMWW